MEKKPSGLHENETNTSCVALIIIDMINDLEFPGATDMFNAAVRAAENIALLKERARQEKLPVIYANDNFGRWRSNFVDITQYCLQSDVRGRPLVEILKPVSDDYFVLKPRHSAFYATPLEQCSPVSVAGDSYCAVFPAICACSSPPVMAICGTINCTYRRIVWLREPKRKTGGPWSICKAFWVRISQAQMS